MYLVAKRALDILGATVGVLLSIPIFIFVPIFIKIDSKGPIFFTQRRCGKDGREFKMLKFRTMVNNAEHIKKKLYLNPGLPFKMREDPRITRIGKFLRKTSIDEIPQFFNVLKGEMSLVGPRPLAKEEIESDPYWKKERLKVKPGITGLWQIYARGSTDIEDWVKYDLLYVKNQSLWLDIKILLKTPFTIITGKGAY
ncbi:MAG: sugar transferase [Deltaproteobacteria bacterium]|nr:MAG: sugar transferase [Deltaproteobacteria bacterium]